MRSRQRPGRPLCQPYGVAAHVRVKPAVLGRISPGAGRRTRATSDTLGSLRTDSTRPAAITHRSAVLTEGDSSVRSLPRMFRRRGEQPVEVHADQQEQHEADPADRRLERHRHPPAKPRRPGAPKRIQRSRPHVANSTVNTSPAPATAARGVRRFASLSTAAESPRALRWPAAEPGSRRAKVELRYLGWSRSGRGRGRRGGPAAEVVARRRLARG